MKLTAEEELEVKKFRALLVEKDYKKAGLLIGDQTLHKFMKKLKDLLSRGKIQFLNQQYIDALSDKSSEKLDNLNDMYMKYAEYLLESSGYNSDFIRRNAYLLDIELLFTLQSTVEDIFKIMDSPDTRWLNLFNNLDSEMKKNNIKRPENEIDSIVEPTIEIEDEEIEDEEIEDEEIEDEEIEDGETEDEEIETNSEPYHMKPRFKPEDINITTVRPNYPFPRNLTLKLIRGVWSLYRIIPERWRDKIEEFGQSGTVRNMRQLVLADILAHSLIHDDGKKDEPPVPSPEPDPFAGIRHPPVHHHHHHHHGDFSHDSSDRRIR